MCQRNCFLNSNRIGRRTIIIWGAGVRGKEMAVLLKGYGYKIEGFIDSYLYGKEETVCGLPIYGKEVLKGKQDAFFVLVAIDRYFQEIKAYLYDQNYTETMDFFWLNRTNIEPEIKNGAYQDDFGNVLNIQCETLKLRVLVNGKNNHLDIDGNVCIKENLIIYLSGGGFISIKNSAVHGLSNINVVDGSSLSIGGKSIIKAYTMSIRQNSSLTIADMLLEDGGSLEVSDSSDCKIADGTMEGTCKVTAYSALFMEQVCNKAKNITVYRKGRLEIRKTGLDKTAGLSVGDAGTAGIFECGIGQASNIIVRNHSALYLKQTRFAEAEIKSTNHAEIAAEESTFEPGAIISANQNTKISICSMEAREGAALIGYFNSQIQIERNCKATKNLYILVNHGSCLSVGKDCVFAQDVTILSGDSHPVFQIDHPQIYEACSRVEISDHVWLGKSCVVLSDAVIGESCIVAPNSVVGKKYPNNCLLMGYPAKIIRQNIAYDLEECNPDVITDRRYWKMTDLEK